ncbi:MAG: F0F1 ATP synthase subunit A [Lachnospiraceae bacterium]|nr:F0F1 ATP synthase subunit A [Lachnospiraceae bacterium]
MEDLAAKLQEELVAETAFTLTLPGGYEIPFAESTVISWCIIAILFALTLWLTHGMKVHNPGKKQVAVETFVKWIDGMVDSMLGEEGRGYGVYICTVLIYLACANMSGLFGVKPPTKDMNQTAGLAIMSIVIVQFAGIRARGMKGWLKSFAEPIAVVLPINILELVIKPLSLCMRLFGNILGAFIIMELIKIVIPVGIPIPFSFYFDIFDGCLQAYVFCFLTSIYIKEAIETA